MPLNLAICQTQPSSNTELSVKKIFNKSQFLCFPFIYAVLARLSREMSQTVRIDCHSFLALVRISVRPSKFFIGVNTQKLAKAESLRECSVEWTSDSGNCSYGWSPATRRKGGGNCSHGWSPTTRLNGDNLNGDNCRHSGNRLSRNGESQQVKTATNWVYIIPSRLEKCGLGIIMEPMHL